MNKVMGNFKPIRFKLHTFIYVSLVYSIGMIISFRSVSGMDSGGL